MTRLNRSNTLLLMCTLGLSALGTLGLAGCAIGTASFPDASVNPSQTPLGSISGSDFGGHAPLVGAHVYVLQPSVTTAGATVTTNAEYNAYGGQATSLLTATYSNNGSNYPATIQNASDPGIPTSWYYLQTDQTGAFNITGDYTCTAGIPVYLYLYGGSPTYPSGSTTASNTFNIASFNITGTDGAYTINFTIDTTSANNVENAYLGEGYVIHANGSANPAGHYPFDTSFQTVLGSGLTTTTFSSSLGTTSMAQLTSGGLAPNMTYNQTGSNMSVTFEPTFNSGVVNLAVLGNCPSTGSFSATNAIKYVYVNEVSTVAAAYAFRPFTNTAQSAALGYQTDCITTYTSNTSGATTSYDWNNATCIGTSSKNLAGLQNAATLAGQLYDITGSNVSTTYAGEGHIARANTTNGNGIVPQALINTLGNILAQCVDSNNGATLVGQSGGYASTTNGNYTGISGQCSTLFTAATSNAIPVGATGAGIQPFDTAMAAFNIARHPGGPPYSYSTSGASTFMTNLYTLPNASNRPFEPDLFSTGAGQPNDFTIGILYPQSLNGTYGNIAESIAIDKIGNAWVTAQSNGAPYWFYEMSPTGVRSNIQSQTAGIYGYVTIDTSGTAYSGLASAVGPITYVKVTGTSTSGNSAAGSYGYPVPYTYSAGSNTTKEENFTYSAFADASGNIYFGNNQTNGSTVNYIVSYTSATATGQESPAIPTFASKNGGITHGAMEPTTGYAYIDFNASGTGNGVPYLASVNVTTGANSYTPISSSTTGCTSLVDPEQMAVTQNGDGLFPDYNNGAGTINAASSSLYFVTSLTVSGSGTCAQISGATVEAGLNSPFGAAIDGGDYAYITNRGNQNGTTISILDMTSSTSTVKAVSPSTGLQPSYVSGSTLTAELYGPLNIAAGPSGELWITNPAGNSLVEIIGLAKPTVTPLASAAFTTAGYGGGTVGTRP